MKAIKFKEANRYCFSGLTWALNIGLMLNLLRNVSAISAVGDLEATAMSIPFSFSAYSMPFAWGYKDGISRLERHSLEKTRRKMTLRYRRSEAFARETC